MKRFKHSLSHYRLLTCDLGQLVPCGLTEVLPGDTIQHSSSILLRFSPLIVPVMHPVRVRLHHFFVPHRLNYPDFEDFITGGPDGEGAANPWPTNAGPGTPVLKDLWDYLGVPIGPTYAAGQLSLMPIRAYNKVFNEFYRDQDLVAEVAEDSDDVQRVAWSKDYFTTARPWTQKGAAITLPLGGSAPVTGTITPTGAPTFSGGGTHTLVKKSGIENTEWDATASANAVASWANPQLSLTSGLADLSAATAADIIDLRRALALQRYQEARAQYGSRYTEYLRYLGVRSADQRLDRPEYLGGGKQTVAFSEVLRTGSDTETSPIGDLKGHGISALRSNRYRYFAEEHGYILSLLSIVPQPMYLNGLPRTFSKRTKEDFYQKELELIGQQELLNSEVYVSGTAGGTDDSETFGYQDRYAEYRHQPSQVSGEFRTTLNFWHMARSFSALPTLNDDFIECDPGKRNFAVQSKNVCWVMVSHNMQARRMVGNKTIGRIL